MRDSISVQVDTGGALISVTVGYEGGLPQDSMENVPWRRRRGSLGTGLLADPGETKSVHTLTPAAR